MPSGGLKLEFRTTIEIFSNSVISPVSFTPIREVKDSAEFRGYLYLNTPRSSSFLGRKFLIKVQVRDRELSRSEAIKLPLTFAYVPKEDIPERWKNAVENGLGGIAIDLEELEDWRSVY